MEESSKLRRRRTDQHQNHSHGPVVANPKSHSDDLSHLSDKFAAALRASPTSADLMLQTQASRKILQLYKDLRWQQKRRRVVIACAVAASVVGLLWFLAFSKSTLGLALIRNLLVAVLPWWNWMDYYKTRCLLLNPGQPDIVPSDENCVICEDLKWIPEFEARNVTSFQIGEDFLVEELPVVIRNAVEPTSREALRVKSMLQMHLNDDFMEPCKFHTNLKTKRAFQFRSFIEKVNRDNLMLPWFAFWEFCKLEHVKEARPVVPRPDIIPTMLEISGSVWFFLSSNMTSHTFKRVELSTPIMWFVQMTGTSRIQLTPKPVCESVCSNLHAQLEPGDLILVTGSLFDFNWMPGDAGEVLAVAAGAQ